jgi:hypothetical protein
MPEREFWVDLSESEINTKAQELSQLMVEFEEVEEEKRAATKEYSDELKGLRAKMRTTSKVIREKKELRPVACEVRFHYPMVGMKQTVRLDTNEVIEQEKMSPAERQENLFAEHQEWDKLFDSNAPSATELPPAFEPPSIGPPEAA